MYFTYFVIISSWKSKLESPSSKNALCQVWKKLVLEKKIFKLILSMYFCCFVTISPWKRVAPFIWTNLNPHHPRMLCAKFCWNWSSGSLNFINVFLLFVIVSPWNRDWPFNWTNLNLLSITKTPRLTMESSWWNISEILDTRECGTAKGAAITVGHFKPMTNQILSTIGAAMTMWRFIANYQPNHLLKFG